MNLEKKIANLHLRLKGFTQPDTASQAEGYLEPGRYQIERYLPNHPDEDTDYALVIAPTLGAGDTWICVR
jgi:hypothetical protein